MRSILIILSAFALLSAAEPEDRYRASWLAIDEAACTQTMVEGQRCEVRVEYGLAGQGPVELSLIGVGPWIDLPDGVHTTKRHHVGYQGLSAQVEVQPGRGQHVFSFTVPSLHHRNSILWIAKFREAGKPWPWEVRLAGGPLCPADPPLRLAGSVPGNLFTYAEPVRFLLAFSSGARPGSMLTAKWTVLGRDGRTLGSGSGQVAVPEPGKSVPITVPCERRGVLGLRVEVEGIGAVETSFARIPDVMAMTRGEETRFGAHGLLGLAPDEVIDRRMQAARRLGLTFCRQNTSWKNLEPARGEWRLDGLDHGLAKAAQHGIKAMLCLVNPPAWAMKGRYSAGFDSFAFDEAGWSDAIGVMTRRFKGRIAAWEWLNEIVPGPEAEPIGNYLALVRCGSEAAKREDPGILSVMAGGLWPRSYRLGLLAAGIGRYVDVLPVHYSAGEAVEEAYADLGMVKADRVRVWDDETAKGVSTWDMPLAEALARTEQRAWAMRQFPGELTAGADRILWFGGAGDAAGNWDYAWQDGSPRPVAATLAMLAAKLHGAEPQGGFSLGEQGGYHLFAKDGKATVIAPAGPSKRLLRFGGQKATVLDDQGEEVEAAVNGMDLDLPESSLPVLVEGGDLEVLRGVSVRPPPSADQPEVLACRSAAIDAGVRAARSCFRPRRWSRRAGVTKVR